MSRLVLRMRRGRAGMAEAIDGDPHRHAGGAAAAGRAVGKAMAAAKPGARQIIIKQRGATAAELDDQLALGAARLCKGSQPVRSRRTAETERQTRLRRSRSALPAGAIRVFVCFRPRASNPSSRLLFGAAQSRAPSDYGREHARATPAPRRPGEASMRSGRPAKPGQNILVKPAFDRQIPRRWRARRQIGPDPLGLGDDRRQAGRRRLALRDVDRRARIGAPHDVGAALGEPDIARNARMPAATEQRVHAEEGGRSLSESRHGARYCSAAAAKFGKSAGGVRLKDPSRRANKLRRRVYRETPVASANRTAELDHRMCYADMAAVLESARLGVSSTGAALALWRAYSEHGLRAWCYQFGFPENLTPHRHDRRDRRRTAGS